MPKKPNAQFTPLADVAPDDARPKPIVLVVDDEIVIADTLVAILARNNLVAMTAYDGQAALDSVQRIPPDLLLTDVAMPGMNGVDLAIAVKRSLPDCKILLFSGQAATTDLLASARRRGHDFPIITKPIHPVELMRRVSESLESENTAGRGRRRRTTL